MTAPWIKKSLQQLIGDSPGNPRKSPEKINRICQVIETHESFRCIVVSDKDFFIPVFLTDLAIANLLNNNCTIRSLHNAIVKLQVYHFSTIYQCAADRDLPVLCKEISRPLVLQCSKIEYLGGDDCTTIGEPRNINKELDSLLKSTGYINILDKLRIKQFPSQKCLPDYGKAAIVKFMLILAVP